MSRHQHTLVLAPLSLQVSFWKRALLGKYVSEKTRFDIENGTNTQKYANNATKLKRKWFSNHEIHDKKYMSL